MTENGFEVAKSIISYSIRFSSICRNTMSKCHCHSSPGKRHGNGEYLYNDGSKYIGNWENDMIKGEGTSWYPNGNRCAIHCGFQCNRSPEIFGHAQFFFSILRYTGEWVNGKINGKGMQPSVLSFLITSISL